MSANETSKPGTDTARNEHTPSAPVTCYAASEPPAGFGGDEISRALKPRKLKRYSMINAATSHASMQEDPAGDWVLWTDAA